MIGAHGPTVAQKTNCTKAAKTSRPCTREKKEKIKARKLLKKRFEANFKIGNNTISVVNVQCWTWATNH